MTALSRVPPGRAGRLWLRRRLDVAERGLDLLQRKLHLLAREYHRLATDADRTGREWAARCRDAHTWTLRVSVADGRRSLRPSSSPADVTVRWTDIMGLRYPVEATCTLPASPPSLPCSAALVEAQEAVRAALVAAVHHAAAREAERRVAQEITATRQRIRALQNRWIPRLTTAIKDIDLALDEMERSDTARLLRAGRADRGPSADSDGTEDPGAVQP
jgi:V/A-type H+-transporting ATPase subunit D